MGVVCGGCLWGLFGGVVCGGCLWGLFVGVVCGGCLGGLFVGVVCGGCLWGLFVGGGVVCGVALRVICENLSFLERWNEKGCVVLIENTLSD